MKDLHPYFTRVSPDFIRLNAKRIKPGDVKKISAHSEEILYRMKHHRRFQDWIPELGNVLTIVKEFDKGLRPDVPFPVIEAIVFTLLFIDHPLDLSPDVHPVVGQIDDIDLFAVCCKIVKDFVPDFGFHHVLAESV
ncbi:MAG: hypothetical protein L6Q77_02300 [Bacteroidetes bacterium]|nr:hypothetical protein [Bacteroidota bacterium]